MNTSARPLDRSARNGLQIMALSDQIRGDHPLAAPVTDGEKARLSPGPE